MFRSLNTLFAAALLLFSAAAFSASGPDDPPGRVARLNHAAGTVSFASADAPDAWMRAQINRPLTAGDRLWADSTGRAELHVGANAIRLGAATSVDVLNLDDDTLQLRLAQGSLNLRVRDLDPGDIVEVATPAGAVVIRQAGSYRISTDAYGDSARVLVYFGQAEIVTPVQTFTLPTGQAATFAARAGASFEVVAHAAQDELDRWSAERDRREDRVTSTRYVSRDMTGYEDLDQYGSWRTLPEYGAVWVPTRVAPGWAPYRHGHWVWVSPWGWTWVDDAPWGFAPSHYGRWVWTDGYWAWAPGPIVRRPVYAPALVAFVGGSHFSIAGGSGPAVGWFPLGWREPYIPWYRSTHRHVERVNVTHVHVTHIHTHVRHVHRERSEAVTVVPRQTFVSARPVGRSHVHVHRHELARAELIRDRSPAEPVRSSLSAERTGQRPPAAVAAREVVSVTAPRTQAARETAAWRERAGEERSGDAEPRVRVLRRERAESSTVGTVITAPAAAAPAAAAAPGGAVAGALRDAAAQHQRNERSERDVRERERDHERSARAAARERAAQEAKSAATISTAPRVSAAPPTTAAPMATTAPAVSSAATVSTQPRTSDAPRSFERRDERRVDDRRDRDGASERRERDERRDRGNDRRERSADNPNGAPVATRAAPAPGSEASQPRAHNAVPREHPRSAPAAQQPQPARAAPQAAAPAPRPQ